MRPTRIRDYCMNEEQIDEEQIDEDRAMKVVKFSISDYVEMATTGFMEPVEKFVENLFLDDGTIVHCLDNNEYYYRCDSMELIAFINEKTNSEEL